MILNLMQRYREGLFSLRNTSSSLFSSENGYHFCLAKALTIWSIQKLIITMHKRFQKCSNLKKYSYLKTVPFLLDCLECNFQSKPESKRFRGSAWTEVFIQETLVMWLFRYFSVYLYFLEQGPFSHIWEQCQNIPILILCSILCYHKVLIIQRPKLCYEHLFAIQFNVIL